MTKTWMIATGAGLALLLSGRPAGSEIIAYPKNGQTQEQFQMDQYQCHQWATGQAGVDPTNPAQQPQPATPSGPPPPAAVAASATGGAIVGTMIGAISGHPGQGAAIGTAIGASTGMMRAGVKGKKQAEAKKKADGEAQAALAKYEKAYAVCLEGRGYQVR
jgi:hypothetical protein